MANAGLKTPDLMAVERVDELIGNRNSGGNIGTYRVAVSKFAQQMAAEGAIKDEIDGVKSYVADLSDGIEAAAAGIVRAASWAGLAAIAGTRAGQPGEVVTTSVGSHVDPVVGGSVPDSGAYTWSTAPVGWRRVGDYVDPGLLEELSDRLPDKPSTATMIPLIVAGNRAVLWLGSEGLEGPGIGTRQVTSAAIVPLITAGRRAVLWLDENGLQGPGLGNRPADTESFQPRMFRRDAKAPIATDGRTLNRYRAKVAALNAGVDAKLKIVMAGDSWCEFATVPAALRAQLAGKFDITGEGFVSVNPMSGMTAATVSHAGWTVVDASADGAFPYGSGPDGQALYTTATDATVTINNLGGTDIMIFYRHAGGTFRYRIDSGAWTVIVCDSSGDAARADISGLTDTLHKVEIDTDGNAGTVSLCGFYASTPTSGAEVLKMGNASLKGGQALSFANQIAHPVAAMDPDLAVIILGTNDYRSSGYPPNLYIAGVTAMIEAYQAAVPGIGIVCCVPARTNAAAVYPLADYRDALYDLCLSSGYEFLNLHDAFGPWVTSNALGLFADALHLNSTGATALVDLLNANMLHL